MVFHEITREAIQFAKENTARVDTALVDAQETRRILDRLYGYEVSPVLWRKVGPGLSAGRVQSAATRLVVDRERERLAFTSASYWDLTRNSPRRATVSASKRVSRASNGSASPPAATSMTPAQLKRPRRSRSRGAPRSPRRRAAQPGRRPHGQRRRVEAIHAQTRRAVHHIDPAAGSRAQAALLRAPDHERRPVAVRERLHHLYAHRFPDAVAAGDHRGAHARRRSSTAPTRSPRSRASTPARARTRKRRTRRSVRPATTFRTPSELHGHAAWQRVQAVRPDLEAHRRLADGRCQGLDGIRHHQGDPRPSRSLPAAAGTPSPSSWPPARSSHSAVSCAHTKRAATRSATGADEADESKLPPLKVGQALGLVGIEAKGHETTPPPRYTEASLVKKLEELGIGRPRRSPRSSPPIIDRGYVTPRGPALVPSWIAFSRRAAARGVLRRPRPIRLHRRDGETTSTGSPTARPTGSTG